MSPDAFLMYHTEVRLHSCLSYSSEENHMGSKMADKPIKFGILVHSESGHLCMQNCSDNNIVEGLHMKKAIVPPNKLSRNPRWLPKFTICKK